MSLERNNMIDMGAIKFENRSARRGHVEIKQSQLLSYDNQALNTGRKHTENRG
jgi:hypothetical protein